MSRPPNARTIATALAIAVLVACGLWLGRATALSPQAVSDQIRALGHWAMPGYVLAFVAAVLLAMPGTLFVIAAPMLFGQVAGFAIAYTGALAAVTAPFLLARMSRGRGRRPATLSRWRRLSALLDRVESSPVRSVILLRLALFMSPPLNYALAFTAIRTRHYVLGSALGIAPAVALIVVAARCLPWL